MQKTLQYKGKEIAYQMKQHKRAKRLSVTVHPDRRVIATWPQRYSENAVERFVYKHAQWIVDRLEELKDVVVRPELMRGRRDYLTKKEEARAVIRERVEFFNAFYNFEYKGIAIKNQKSLWGSCSARKNLNFNYRLLYLPERLRDYIVVHEICHLQQMNHGKRFWELVARVFPDHRKLEKLLRTEYRF